MYRVTYTEDNKTITEEFNYYYIYISVLGNEYYSFERIDDYSGDTLILEKDIIKVEKLVNHLTSEDELKFNFFSKSFIYDGKKYRVRYTLNAPRRYEEFYLDEYIDVTKFVKGGRV